MQIAALLKKIKLCRKLKRYGNYIYSRNILDRNLSFKNIHKGRRCFVIGNGASLNDQDLSLLKGEITFAMSGFWKHSVVNQWQPRYYFFADPLMFDGSLPMCEFFSLLRDKISRSTFFVPLYAKGIIEKQKLLEGRNVFFVLFDEPLSETRSTKSIDLSKLLPSVISVSEFAVEAAIYMGCSPIYLLGMDHDWLSHRGMDKHFYEGKTIIGHPKAHNDLGRNSYKSDALDVINLWNGYEFLLRVAESKRIKIINATSGGFLDVFERINYMDIFK